ncbi:MAG TPA: HAMP domain-containing protein [Phycisphaerales bacterium]|nr:HAMP domain-containing protein [Phycisphaerales bacterium]
MPLRLLKTRILSSLLTVIFVLAAPVAVLGYFAIKRDILDTIQERVDHDLRAARMVYRAELTRLAEMLELACPVAESQTIRRRLGVDYLAIVREADIADVPSEIARQAAETDGPVAATRVITAGEMERLKVDPAGRMPIAIKPTPRARPTQRDVLQDALAMEAAVMFDAPDGQGRLIAYAGRIINGQFTLVDRIRELVFTNDLYDGKPVGTVTIFQDDVRVSTNVLDDTGRRAVGTRVSERVYEQVVEKGRTFHDRAFVVTDWYKTAYEPIKDVGGHVIGILYVGILEQPFMARARTLVVQFLVLVGGAVLLTVVLALLLATAISRPLLHMMQATTRLSDGELGYQINHPAHKEELDALGLAFNEMSEKLEERDRNLRATNEKLTELNKSYVDLIGFVAHELKGILASTVLNAYAVRDGYLGLINFKQRKAMDSVTRNLDYLAATVRKFLNLGRVERGELSVTKVRLNLGKDVFEESLQSLAALIAKKNVRFENEIAADLVVEADLDLMQIVANNLVSNAIKYCTDRGVVRLSSRRTAGGVQIEVYNDSPPITEEQRARLFAKFYRLDNEQTRKVRGAGLGLYITKQIVESHGGRIWVEPRPQGNAFIFELK